MRHKDSGFIYKSVHSSDNLSAIGVIPPPIPPAVEQSLPTGCFLERLNPFPPTNKIGGFYIKLKKKSISFGTLYLSIMKNNTSVEQPPLYLRIWKFYLDGFRNMTVGKTLWAIILIKLFIMFFVLKLFFFPNLLSRDYDTDEERAKHVTEELTRPLPL